MISPEVVQAIESEPVSGTKVLQFIQLLEAETTILIIVCLIIGIIYMVKSKKVKKKKNIIGALIIIIPWIIMAILKAITFYMKLNM